MHHPLPRLAVLALAATGVLPPVFYVGAIAWLGHLVLELGIGDRLRGRDGFLPPLPTLAAPPRRRPAAGGTATPTSAELPHEGGCDLQQVNEPFVLVPDVPHFSRERNAA
jgi:hypothetical protein